MPTPDRDFGDFRIRMSVTTFSRYLFSPPSAFQNFRSANKTQHVGTRRAIAPTRREEPSRRTTHRLGSGSCRGLVDGYLKSVEVQM
jgi:hypothetical protein